MPTDNDLPHPFRRVYGLAMETFKVPGPRLSPGVLKKLDVEIHQMDIESGESTDGGPQFRIPFDKRDFETVFENAVHIEGITQGGKYNSEGHEKIDLQLIAEEAWDEDEFSNSMQMAKNLVHALGSRFPNNLAYHGRYMRRDCKPNHPLERLELPKPSSKGEYWTTGSILDTFDRNDPLSCLLCESAELDESWVLRNEVHCAAAMIARRIKCRERKVIPSFVYTLSGHKARVIHAYLNDATGKLVIRKTKIISFRDNHRLENFKLMVRWIMNKQYLGPSAASSRLLQVPKSTRTFPSISSILAT